MAKNQFYVVWKGNTTGIFDNWYECATSIHYFAGAEFEGFTNRAQAEKAFSMTYQEWQEYKRARGDNHGFPGLW